MEVGVVHLVVLGRLSRATAKKVVNFREHFAIFELKGEFGFYFQTVQCCQCQININQ